MVLKRSKLGLNTGNSFRFGHRLYLYKHHRKHQHVVVKKVKVVSTRDGHQSNAFMDRPDEQLDRVLCDGMENTENEDDFHFSYCDKVHHWIRPLEYSANKRKRWTLCEHILGKVMMTQNHAVAIDIDVDVIERQLPVRESYHVFSKADLLRTDATAFHTSEQSSSVEQLGLVSVFPISNFSSERNLKTAAIRHREESVTCQSTYPTESFERNWKMKNKDRKRNERYIGVDDDTVISDVPHIKKRNHRRSRIVNEKPQTKVYIKYEIFTPMTMTSHRMHMAPKPNADHCRENKISRKAKKKGRGKSKLTDGVDYLSQNLLQRFPQRTLLQKHFPLLPAAPDDINDCDEAQLTCLHKSVKNLAERASVRIENVHAKVNSFRLSVRDYLEEIESGFVLI